MAGLRNLNNLKVTVGSSTTGMTKMMDGLGYAKLSTEVKLPAASRGVSCKVF